MNALATAILAVMGEVGYVYKDKRVEASGMNYSFAGEAALLRALRPAMVRHGLAMVPVACDLREHHEVIEKKGRDGSTYTQTSRTVRVVHTYRLLHASGEHLDIVAAGEGQDAGDKATAKAQTIALKYALRQAFLIETGDDPDRERPEEEPAPRERPDERLFREQGEAARQVLRDLGATSQASAHRLIQEASEGALSYQSLQECPGEVLATMREWRDLQHHLDGQEERQ